ncbi:hypothetical protein FRB99_000274 [Tulasnella sp. 403]|nr:hypothetical protein FRB99_000274 [Tulasnella sp. 403]
MPRRFRHALFSDTLEPKPLMNNTQFNVPVFRGTEGLVNVEDFIQGVRKKALEANRHLDLQWTAMLAAAHLSGEALHWHFALDESIQNDWNLLTRALLDRYATTKPNANPSQARLSLHMRTRYSYYDSTI